MVGEDPEGEAAVLDDRLSAAARIPDPVDRVERAIQGCGSRGRRGGEGDRWRNGGGVVGMHERSSSNPRRMQQERCRRSIQSPPFRPTFIHRHSCYSPMRKKESVFREISPLSKFASGNSTRRIVREEKIKANSSLNLYVT